ncbi:hypothetical protein HA402_014904 [Bradysia odoriphaga]|nr:hypothetical protein HA402_014904 [Bradysia odoriphaga]
MEDSSMDNVERKTARLEAIAELLTSDSVKEEMLEIARFFRNIGIELAEKKRALRIREQRGNT